jgi:hypothetical protein
MGTLSLSRSRLVRGIWQGLIKGTPADSPPPSVDVRHMGHPVEDVRLSREAGGWRIEVTVPAAAISDGVQVLTMTDADTGARLGYITLVAGEPVAEDLRAEVALLRAELDLLKRAFRRHCDETGG